MYLILGVQLSLLFCGQIAKRHIYVIHSLSPQKFYGEYLLLVLIRSTEYGKCIFIFNGSMAMNLLRKFCTVCQRFSVNE
jgi:hypothetical protein